MNTMDTKKKRGVFDFCCSFVPFVSFASFV
jgi:hypothetical protein